MISRSDMPLMWTGSHDSGFIAYGLLGPFERKRAAVGRRENVQPVRCDQRRSVRPRAGRGTLAVAGARIDAVDHTRFARGDVNAPGDWIEKRDVRSAGERPLVCCGSGTDIDLHQRAVVTGDVEAAAFVVDVETMGAVDWERPVLDTGQIG